MQKAVLLTLEAPGFKGGIARYIEAITLTYPMNVEVISLSPKAEYPEIFSAFWSSRPRADVYFIQHLLPVGTVAWLTSFLGGRPYVIFLHGMDFAFGTKNPWKRFLTKRILKNAKSLVTNSEALKLEVEVFLHSSTKPIVVYPSVSDALLVESMKKEKTSLEELGELAKLASGALGAPLVTKKTPNRPFTLLTVGRLVKRKGHLKVIGLLPEMPDVHYHIVGEGIMESDLRKEAEELGVSDRVAFLKASTDAELAEAYRASDVFVMPTDKEGADREGFGIVYLEAGLFGLPVIATNMPGVSEAVIDAVTGILVDDTKESLADAVTRLKADHALSVKLGNAGRLHAREFTKEKTTAPIENILR